MAESGTRTTGPVNQRLLDISANDTNSDASIILRSREKNTSNVKKSNRGLISFSPHSNTIVNQKLIFPQTSGTVGQVLKIDSVSNTNNLTLNWGEGGGGSSALTYTNSALQSDNNSLLRLTSSTGTESDIMFIAGNNITLGTSISSQYQLGNDITPPTTDLHFGGNVKMNSTGDRVLISTGAKSLHMYKLTNNTWSQLGNVIESGGNTVWTIDMDNSGDVVAFGNYIRSHGGLTMRGSTKVLKYTTSTNWQIVNTEIFGQYTQDREGESISLSGNGNVIATSSRWNDEAGTNNGQVRIFEDTSSGWNQRGSDLHLSGYSGDTTRFGRLIQLNENGNILAVFSDRDNVDIMGNVRFFQYANNTWTQYSIIRRISTDYRLNYYPLMELNNDGDIIALQTQNTSTGDYNLVVYSYSGSSWNQRGNLLNFGDRMTDLAIDNDITTIAVGTDQYSTGGLYRGLAKFYKYNNNTWSQIGTTLIGEASQHYMGGALSINSTGTRAIVGIEGYGRPTTSPFGKVEIYNLPGTVNNAITINSTGSGGSGIVNNRIDGDLTIGEDDSEMLTIASKLHIPGGESGQVLTKGTDGSIEYGPTAFDSVSINSVGFKVYKSGSSVEEVTTNTAVLFDQTTTNVGAGSYSTTAGTYTVPVTGYYNIFANFTLPTVIWCGYANQAPSGGFYANYDDGTQIERFPGEHPGLINDTNGSFNTTTGIFTCSIPGIYRINLFSIGVTQSRANLGLYKNNAILFEFIDIASSSNYQDNGNTVIIELISNDTLRIKEDAGDSEIMFSGQLIKSGIDYRIQKSTNSGTTYTDLVTSSDKSTTSIVESLNQNDLIRVISGDGSTGSTLNFEQGSTTNSFGAQIVNQTFTTANPLLANPSTADKGKIVTVNAAGNDLEYGANFRELACKQTLITNAILIQDSSFDSTEGMWIDLASHGNLADNVNTNMNTETTVNVSQNSKVQIKASINVSLTPSNVFSFGIRLGKKVDGNIIWGNSAGKLNRNLGSSHSSIIADEAQNDPKGASGTSAVRCWQSNTLRDGNSIVIPMNASYIDEDPTNGQSGYHNVTYFIRVLLFYVNNTNFWIGRTDSPGDDTPILPTILSATEIGSGAITSFTQEQALAGAGGTAAFTAYGLYGNNATDVVTGTNGDGGSHGHYWNTNTEAEHISNNDITADVAIRLESTTTPVGISYEFTTPQIITKYRIWMHSNSSAALAKTPKQWEFRAATDKSTYVSTDSSKYTVLDSQSNVTTYPYITGNNGNTASNNPNLANEYNLSTIGAYKYYVLHVTSIQSSDVFSISELALYGGGFTIPSQVGNAGKQLITNGTSLTWGSPSSILVPSPTGNANKVLQANSAGTGLEYGAQKSIDFTAFTETAIRTDQITDWWEVFGPTSSALAVCSGIIPQTLTSKMHIMIVIHLSGHDTDPYFQGILYRNVHVGTNSNSLRSSTAIGINTDTTITPDTSKVSFTQKADYRHVNLHQENISFSFVDDLTSSGIQSGDKVTYTVKVRNRGADTGQNTIRINRYGAINNHNYSTSVSTLTVVEY